MALRRGVYSGVGVLLACCCQLFLLACCAPRLASGARATRALQQERVGEPAASTSSVATTTTAATATATAKQAGLVATTAGCTLRRGSSLNNESDDDADGLDERAVLLRVSPWAGCGAQVTFGLGWDRVLPVSSSASFSSEAERRAAGVRYHGSFNNFTTPVQDEYANYNTSTRIGVGVVTRYPASPGASLRPSAAVTRAPQQSGMTTVALALSGDAESAARQLAAAAALVEALPDGRGVSL
jgi:hypothetical protein